MPTASVIETDNGEQSSRQAKQTIHGGSESPHIPGKGLGRPISQQPALNTLHSRSQGPPYSHWSALAVPNNVSLDGCHSPLLAENATEVAAAPSALVVQLPDFRHYMILEL